MSRVVAAMVLTGLLIVAFAGGVPWQSRDGRAYAGGSGTATAEQQAAAAKLLDDVRAGTTRFASLQTAMNEGYQQTTPFRFGQWGPAHFNNRQYTREKRFLEPERPSALVYMRTQDGRNVVIGVMFLAPKGQGPRPGGPITEWHVHDNLCITSTGAADVAMAPGQCPPGSTFLGEAVEMMHVWIFENPDGTFAHSLTTQSIRAAVQYATRR
jgi:hypothetical protein